MVNLVSLFTTYLSYSWITTTHALINTLEYFIKHQHQPAFPLNCKQRAFNLLICLMTNKARWQKGTAAFKAYFGGGDWEGTQIFN